MRPTPPHSTAVPGSGHDVRTRPVTNHTAPVEAGSRAAVEPADGERARAVLLERDGVETCIPYLFVIPGGLASGAGAARMAGPAGAGRPGSFEVPSL